MKTGIFFDGYHCQKFWQERDKKEKYEDKLYNKLDLTTIINGISKKINKQKYSVSIKYKAWFQGIKDSHFDKDTDPNNASREVLRKLVWNYHNDRNLYIHLIRHGVESVFLEHALDENGNYKEKGIDTALVINCLKNVVELDLECVILCTNDSDFEPLIHTLKKKDICVIVVTFEPDNKVSERLKRQCDYQFDYSTLK